ncbi:hypothetical protein DWU89_03380 [Parabacteroides acidifaciens]|uniref:Uncharacterized protein n=1 Tax=Parabacteroides acidifaciens TaxID=2290935 RepID=A0A3D8HHS3_9BACT|nr:hypothetical protein DWU89_03380 [Parabacteroides acidifaciens]
MYAFRDGLRTSFYLLSVEQAKTVKKVSSKSIKISDEIEKRQKKGLLYNSCLQKVQNLNR